MTEAPSDTHVVAVCRERAKDCQLPKMIKKYMATKSRLIHPPPPEVRDIVKVRQSRNVIYHRSKMEVSENQFAQYVATVRCLIEQALRPYFPKEYSDGYLAKLDGTACSEFHWKVHSMSCLMDCISAMTLFRRNITLLKQQQVQ